MSATETQAVLAKQIETWAAGYPFDDQPTETTKCLSCQYGAKREAGEPLSRAERAHWMLWGCTCDPADEAEAIAFMERMTQ